MEIVAATVNTSFKRCLLQDSCWHDTQDWNLMVGSKENKRPTWPHTYSISLQAGNSGLHHLCSDETSKTRTSEHEQHIFITGNRMNWSHAAPTAACCASENVSLIIFLQRQSLFDEQTHWKLFLCQNQMVPSWSRRISIHKAPMQHNCSCCCS